MLFLEVALRNFEKCLEELEHSLASQTETLKKCLREISGTIPENKTRGTLPPQ